MTTEKRWSLPVEWDNVGQLERTRVFLQNPFFSCDARIGFNFQNVLGTCCVVCMYQEMYIQCNWRYL